MMTPLEARLTGEVESLSHQLEAVTLENKLLREKVDLLIRRIFGKSSEQLDDQQLMLLLQGDDGAKKDPASSASPGVLEAEIERRGKNSQKIKPRKEREARVPEHLPAVDEVVEPEEVAAAPAAWRHIGEEITQQLDYQPARFLRRRIIRRKYVRRDAPHQAPVIAPLNTLQERSIAAPGLLAQIIVAKYCDHLPLYRQEQIYATRHDINLRAKAWPAGSDLPPTGSSRPAAAGGIDPQTYLRDVLTRLPTLTNWQIKDVTPAAWAKAQQTTAQRQAA